MEESEQKRDLSEVALLWIKSLPYIAAAMIVVVSMIEDRFGDTKLLTWIKTGRVDGAAEHFEGDQDQQFSRDDSRAGMQTEMGSTGGMEVGVGDVWPEMMGICAMYNNPDLIFGRGDGNGDGMRDTYDPSKPIFKTAWEMQRLVFGQSDGPYYEVVGGTVRAVYIDLTDPAFRSHVNGVEICVLE